MGEEILEPEPSQSQWIGLRVITGPRMAAIWSYAKEEGYKNLKEFWEAMHAKNWDFYDVIKASCRE